MISDYLLMLMRTLRLVSAKRNISRYNILVNTSFIYAVVLNKLLFYKLTIDKNTNPR